MLEPDTASPAVVSTVITCYNKAPTVEEAIRGALGQSHPATECVVINDGSTDNSAQIIAKAIAGFAERVRLIEQENKGANPSRNIGAQAASGDYLLFLDADDVISPDMIEGLMAALQRNGHGPAVGVAPWDYLWERSPGVWVERPGLPLTPPKGDTLASWLGGWYVPPCAVLWPRRVLEQVGFWNEDLSVYQDHELMLRALLNGVRFAAAETGRAWYRKSVSLPTISNQRSRAAFEDMKQVIGDVETKLDARGQRDRYRKPLAASHYALARMAFGAGFIDEGRRSLDACFALGGNRHMTGTPGHRLACALLGLERKERLSRWRRRRRWGSELPGEEPDPSDAATG